VAGFGKGSAQVQLAPDGDATTLSYAVKASVGGKLAQIGSRLVDAAAKKIANDFFSAFNDKMASLHATPPEDEAGGAGGDAQGGHGANGAQDAHHPEPVPRDPDLPTIKASSAAIFDAGALVVFVVALITLFG
jgi:hypothetical protein